jgi:hypothetical protein
MKKISLLITSLVFTVVLAACGSGGGSGEGAATGSNTGKTSTAIDTILGVDTGSTSSTGAETVTDENFATDDNSIGAEENAAGTSDDQVAAEDSTSDDSGPVTGDSDDGNVVGNNGNETVNDGTPLTDENATAKEIADAINNQLEGEDGTGANSGITNNDQVAATTNVVVVNLDNGYYTASSGDSIPVLVLVNGVWQLNADVDIRVLDNLGASVGWSIYNPDTLSGNCLILIPAEPLTAQYSYVITLKGPAENGTVITEDVAIQIPVDETSDQGSVFANVAVVSAGTYNASDHIVDGKLLMGWVFGNAFRISLNGLNSGDKVTLTFYGIYDLAGHEHQVYYQRWSGDGTPVANWNWAVKGSFLSGYYTNAISVDEKDSSLDTEINDYSFASTYWEIRVVDRNGKDVTATRNFRIVIQ